jgi:hypothetical protein
VRKSLACSLSAVAKLIEPHLVDKYLPTIFRALLYGDASRGGDSPGNDDPVENEVLLS